jgi:hypothetical protein
MTRNEMAKTKATAKAKTFQGMKNKNDPTNEQ